MDATQFKMMLKHGLRSLYQEGFTSEDILDIFNETTQELLQESKS